MIKQLKGLPIIFLFLFSNCGLTQEVELLSLNVNVGGRSFSKLPFIIAKDLEIYKKYGLNVDIRLSAPEFEGGITTGRLFRRRELDLRISGMAPEIMSQISNAHSEISKAIGSTDCHTRAVIVGKKDATLPYSFKDKRIGVSNYHTTTHYIASLLARRKGLDPVHDVSIILKGQTYEDLENDQVDAVVMAEMKAAVAIQEGYNILEDASKWNEPIAGNSIIASARWLENEANHIKATNFLKAVSEALSILHNEKDLTLKILTKWYGISDSELLELVYEESKSMPKIPYICVDGVKSTLAMYKSFITEQYSPADFYDDRFVKELEQSGFFNSL